METTLIWGKYSNNYDWGLHAKEYSLVSYQYEYLTLGKVLKAEVHDEYDVSEGYIVLLRVPPYKNPRMTPFARVPIEFRKLADAKRYLYDAVSWYSKVLSCDNDAWSGRLSV